MPPRRRQPSSIDPATLFSADVRFISVVRNTVWTAQKDGSVAIRSMSGEQIGLLEKVDGVVTCIHVVNQTVWLGYSTGQMLIYSIKTKSLVAELSKHTAAISCLSSWMDTVFSAGADWKVHHWDATRFLLVRSYAHSGTVRALCADFRHLYSGGSDRIIRMWDFQNTGSCRTEFAGHKAPVTAIIAPRCTPSVLWSASEDRTIHCWDIENMCGLRVLDLFSTTVSQLVDMGASVWAATTAGSLHIINTMDFSETGVSKDHGGPVTAMATVAPQTAQQVWTACTDGKVRVWQEAGIGETDLDLALPRAVPLTDAAVQISSLKAALAQAHADLAAKDAKIIGLEQEVRMAKKASSSSSVEKQLQRLRDQNDDLEAEVRRLTRLVSELRENKPPALSSSLFKHLESTASTVYDDASSIAPSRSRAAARTSQRSRASPRQVIDESALADLTKRAAQLKLKQVRAQKKHSTSSSSSSSSSDSEVFQVFGVRLLGFPSRPHKRDVIELLRPYGRPFNVVVSLLGPGKYFADIDFVSPAVAQLVLRDFRSRTVAGSAITAAALPGD
eukprot:TRINITY_DN4849_c0_g1_i1.p1 TRINITY_DN4849_c0_g1~~TRINITY_DN4849_c0_g1_i1.p1  ORF type:complete len:567 (-),score=62.47 TRINITY_DN4849_c0_g1_i1:12-1688(-)